MDIDRIRGAIAQMKLNEKVSLVGGDKDTAAVARLNVPDMDMGEALMPYAADEPSALALGCTFSPALCAAVARARSMDAVRNRKAFAGTIACGLVRDPMRTDACEFFSEDAVLTYELLNAYASAGVIGFVYTDALGQGRFENRTVDSRALRELYLYPLEHAGKYAAAVQLDGGYLNGARVVDSREIADMYAACIPTDAMMITPYGYGCGMNCVTGSGAYMLGATASEKKSIAHAVVDGKLFENRLNSCIERTVATVVKTHEFYKKQLINDFSSVNIVVDSTVLLKNDGILPASPKSITVFGDPDAFDDSAAFRILPIKDAPKKYGEFNLFLITDYGCELDQTCVSAIRSAGTAAQTVVVLCGGAAAELHIEPYANAILYCPYCPSVSAVLAMLTTTSPRGHLPFTWAKTRAAYPVNNEKYIERGDFRYESVYNGYRLFNNYASDVMYPFGHGLDFTTYDINKLSVSCDKLVVTVEFIIKNTGGFAGSALCQAYITLIGGTVYGQTKRLAAFKRVALEATENARVRLDINLNDFPVYDETNNTFAVVGGKYRVDIGLSSRDIRASAEIKAPAGSRINAGLSEKLAPSYYEVGQRVRFDPTAPEIERLLKVPFIKKPDEYEDIVMPDPSKIKHVIKHAEKTTHKRLLPRVRHKIEKTP